MISVVDVVDVVVSAAVADMTTLMYSHAPAFLTRLSRASATLVAWKAPTPSC